MSCLQLLNLVTIDHNLSMLTDQGKEFGCLCVSRLFCMRIGGVTLEFVKMMFSVVGRGNDLDYRIVSNVIYRKLR